MSRICEALDQADVARATVNDLDDHVLVGATIQLAEDLEAFALSLAGRLSELGELPGARRPGVAARSFLGVGPAPAAARGRYRNPAP